MKGSIELLLARREQMNGEVSCLWRMSVEHIPKCLELEIYIYISQKEFSRKIGK
jgi:hypothetical protein